MCGYLLHAPYWDLACNPGMYPDWELNCDPLVHKQHSIHWATPARASPTLFVVIYRILDYSINKVVKLSSHFNGQVFKSLLAGMRLNSVNSISYFNELIRVVFIWDLWMLWFLNNLSNHWGRGYSLQIFHTGEKTLLFLGANIFPSPPHCPC